MGQHTGIAGNLKESDSHGGAFNICRDQSSEILGGFFTSSTGFDSTQLRTLKGHSFFLADELREFIFETVQY
jgi:hypothetical protein